MNEKQRIEREKKYEKIMDKLRKLKIVPKGYVPSELENTKTFVLASYWLGKIDALKSLGYGPDEEKQMGEKDG